MGAAGSQCARPTAPVPDCDWQWRAACELLVQHDMRQFTEWFVCQQPSFRDIPASEQQESVKDCLKSVLSQALANSSMLLEWSGQFEQLPLGLVLVLRHASDSVCPPDVCSWLDKMSACVWGVGQVPRAVELIRSWGLATATLKLYQCYKHILDGT